MRWTDRFDKRTVAGASAWAGLTAYVVAADAALIVTNNATLSETFETSVMHPVRRYPVIVLWAVVTVHLLLPRHLKIKKADPIHQVGRLAKCILK